MTKHVLILPFLLLIILCLSTACRQTHERNDAPKEFVLSMPLGLDANAQYIPEDNPFTTAKVELGRVLYFDKRLSVDNTMSCATCHDPKLGFADGKPVSTGIKGLTGTRNAPTVLNRLFSKEQFWDGRGADLEAQALGPIENPVEMGANLEDVVEKLNAIEEYRKAFQEVFGAEVTADGIGKAIAAFERTLLAGNSSYDRYQAGDVNAISESAKRGLALFENKANCVTCHVGFNFSDENYRNIGVGMEQENPDLGRYTVTKLDEDRGAFKTPTLRHIAKTAPYMHDGSEATLMDVVEFYNKGGVPNPHLSTDIEPLNLTEQEKADLVAFMESLTCEMPEIVAPQSPQIFSMRD